MHRPGQIVLRRSAVGALLFVMCCFASNFATAQSRTLDVQRFQPALDDAGFIGLDGTRTPEPFRFAFALFLDLALDPVELELDEDQFVPVQKRIATHVSAEVGLFGRLAVAIRLPLILHQEGQMLPPPNADELTNFALADPQLVVRYRFVGVSMVDRDAPRDGPGLALQLGATLPIGTEDAYASDGATQLDAALLGDFQLLGAGAGASLGFRHHFRDAAGADLELKNEFTFAVGLKLPLPPAPFVVALLEFRGATAFEGEPGTAMELALGANLTIGDFVLALAGSLGLTDGLGAPDGRVVLGVRWSPTDSDQDGDGLSDGDDQCPFLAEDKDGYNDTDGCPEPDNDNDLVPDLDDRCPDEQAVEGRDEDEDGCTDPPKGK
jgi:hypothetical protein